MLSTSAEVSSPSGPPRRQVPASWARRVATIRVMKASTAWQSYPPRSLTTRKVRRAISSAVMASPAPAPAPPAPGPPATAAARAS